MSSRMTGSVTGWATSSSSQGLGTSYGRGVPPVRTLTGTFFYVARTVRVWALICAFLLGCGGAPAATIAQPPTVGTWEQTWAVPYGDTTCVHWDDQMDAHQQRVMAGDMLLRAHRLEKPGAPIPPLEQIYTLVRAVDQFCAAEGRDAGMSVPEVVTYVYLLADDLKP